jgi:hypothetical protein
LGKGEGETVGGAWGGVGKKKKKKKKKNHKYLY